MSNKDKGSGIEKWTEYGPEGPVAQKEVPKNEPKNEPKEKNGNGHYKAVMEIAKRDEKQIYNELMGATVKEYFYQFKLGTRTVTGLSIKGVNEIARRMGNIHVDKPEITEKEDRFEVMVKASDMKNNLVSWGLADQPKKMQTSAGLITDQFALQKAYSKARRNAIRQFLPESIISSAYEKWQKEQMQHSKDAKSFM